MNFRGHLFWSTILFCILYYIIYVYGFVDLSIDVWKYYGVFMLFALFPDIDTDSHPQTLFYAAFLAIEVVLFFLKKYLYMLIFTVAILIPLISKHRGITHNFLTSIILPATVFLFTKNYYFFVAGVIGYWSHLFLDFKIVAKIFGF